MISLLSGLFTQNSFIPHGVCLAWDPSLMLLFVSPNSAIAFAYYSIPIALIYFIYKRRDLAFRGIFALTGAFILACGTTHVMDVVTLWYPAYWLDVIVKFFTAAISIFTAAAMWWVMPAALALPSTAQLEETNRRLQHEITERERAQAALREANAELERRVVARTAELEDEVARRRRTEEILRVSEQRWRSMFEASAVGIALTDENRRFVAANEAFQKNDRLHGQGAVPRLARSRSPTRMTGKRPVRCSTTCSRAGAPIITSRSATGARTATVIWVRVSTAQAPEPGSSLRGIPTIIEDITERKRAEDALQETREALLRVSRVSTMGELSGVDCPRNQPAARRHSRQWHRLL